MGAGWCGTCLLSAGPGVAGYCGEGARRETEGAEEPEPGSPFWAEQARQIVMFVTILMSIVIIIIIITINIIIIVIFILIAIVIVIIIVTVIVIVIVIIINIIIVIVIVGVAMLL